MMARLDKQLGSDTDQYRDRPGDSPEDWAVGDLAECIDAEPFDPVQIGTIYSVTGLLCGYAMDGSGCPALGLFLAEVPTHPFAMNARCFRKVKPRADAEERADAAFIERITPSHIETEETGPARELEPVT